MNTQELEAAIATYNAVEAEQAALRLAIFEAFHGRRGYKSIKIGGREQWNSSSCGGRVDVDAGNALSHLGSAMVVESLGE
jgi:hypothetical protein